jgi:hypothetical protein
MPTTPLPSPEAFARAYDTPGYEDPYHAVEDYQRYVELAGEHSDLGSHALATRLDLPRGRVRAWTNGARPDVVRGLQTAKAANWLATTPASAARERGVVELAAWVLSSGSLSRSPTEGARVAFVVDAGRREDFAETAAAAGLTYRIVHDTTDERATEARPGENGSVFARVLHAMGVPAGTKTADAPTALPPFVRTLASDLREAFARVYVYNRGTDHPDKQTLTLQEQRPASYLEDLAVLLRTVTGERVTHSDHQLTVSAAAARQLTK